MIRNVTPIRLEWDDLGGFTFTFCGLDIGWFEGELLGITWKMGKYIYIYFFFARIEITKPWY